MDTPLPPGNEESRRKARKSKYTVFCCHGGDCTKNGAREALKELRAQIRELGLKHEVRIVKTECADECKNGPIVIVGAETGSTPSGLAWYRKVHPKDAASIAAEHLLNGQVVEKKRLDVDD